MMWNTFALEAIMKHSDAAPLYKNAGIKARGKDSGNPCPAVQGHVGLAAVQGWVKAWH